MVNLLRINVGRNCYGIVIWYYEAIYEKCTCKYIFKDTECKYLFASEICSLVYADEDGGITGKTDLEIQSIPELGRFYYEDDKKILATGEGSEYVSEIPIEGKDSLYYEIKKNAVRDSDGNIIGIVGIVSNVTNRVRLEKQVEELSIMDGLTQAYNRNYLKYKLEENY